jgi:two-component system, OmpR family, response regulator
MRILHIEDDTTLRGWVKAGLTREGFAVDGAATAKEGLQLAAENIYDIILLDIMMPDLNGYWALRTLRQTGCLAAVFMISGQAGEEDKRMAYEAGADDYLTKPIFISELVLKIRRWLQRRSEAVSANETPHELKAGKLRLDLLKRRTTIDDRFIPLTPKEMMVLEFLIRHVGRVVTQTQLAQAVWSLDFETATNVVEVHISRLRKKIDEPGKPSLIQTVHSAGYMINPDAD